jgi:hypothetical protein
MKQTCIIVVPIASQPAKLIRSTSPITLPNDFAEAFVNITGDKVSAPIRHPSDTPQPVRMIDTDLTTDHMTTGLKTKQITHYPKTPLPLRYDFVAIKVKVSHICALLPENSPP